MAGTQVSGFIIQPAKTEYQVQVLLCLVAGVPWPVAGDPCPVAGDPWPVVSGALVQPEQNNQGHVHLSVRCPVAGGR